MAAAYQWGYRVAIIVAGAVPLLLADVYGWNFSYGGDGGADGDRVVRGPRGAARTAPQAFARSRPRASSPHRDAMRSNGAASLLSPARWCSVRSHRQRRRAWRARRIGAAGTRDAVLAAWASDARVWVHCAAVVLGFGVIVLAALPLPGARTRPGATSPQRSAIRCAISSRAIRSAGRPDPRADLPLSDPGLRAQHHEPVLSRSRLQPGRDRRSAEDLWRRHDDAGACLPGGWRLRAMD